MSYIRTLIQKIQKQKSFKMKGFTLVEALVSLGLFSIVIVSATGVILSVISSNRKNQAISAVVNNLNYSIESMVRDIKTGYRYHCNLDGSILSDFELEKYKLRTESCTSNQTVSNITLVSTITGKEQVVRYELFGTGDDAYIKKTLYNQTSPGVVPTTVSYPLTDQKNISISKLAFTVNTPESIIPRPTPPAVATVGQPSVFFVLMGDAKINQINISKFFIQTFISQRLPNFI